MQYVTEEKKRVTVAIPLQLHNELIDRGFGVTEGIIKGLELLLEPRKETDQTTQDNTASSFNQELLSSLQARITGLEEQIKVKDSQLESKDAQMDSRVSSLEEQLRVKDSQLEKQAFHIQTMLTQKAIEAPGAKKPWWRFW